MGFWSLRLLLGASLFVRLLRWGRVWPICGPQDCGLQRSPYSNPPATQKVISIAAGNVGHRPNDTTMASSGRESDGNLVYIIENATVHNTSPKFSSSTSDYSCLKAAPVHIGCMNCQCLSTHTHIYTLTHRIVEIAMCVTRRVLLTGEGLMSLLRAVHRIRMK